jgi:hypothetical protein
VKKFANGVYTGIPVVIDDVQVGFARMNPDGGILIDTINKSSLGKKLYNQIKEGSAKSLTIDTTKQKPSEKEVHEVKCESVAWSWDYFPMDAVDPYYITCDRKDTHTKHHNDETGLDWYRTPISGGEESREGEGI